MNKRKETDELCEQCKKEEATVLRLQVRNGKKLHLNLCDDCSESDE